MRPVQVLTALTLLLSASLASAAPTPGQQTAEMYEGNGAKLGYLLHVPAAYKDTGDKKWPVILFLHGSGERGNGTTDLEKNKKHGPPKLVEKQTKDFIVISPQCPKESRWEAKSLKGLLDEVMGKLKNADADRVYLTGLSMGGFGSWMLAAAYPDTFAAVVPICGGGSPATAGKIKDLPIWVFHGDKDTAVKIDMSQAMVDALKAAGAKNVQFTIYPGVGHDSWTQTYADPKLYEWMLKQTRAKK
jgi:predicted peptidase